MNPFNNIYGNEIEIPENQKQENKRILVGLENPNNNNSKENDRLYIPVHTLTRREYLNNHKNFIQPLKPVNITENLDFFMLSLEIPGIESMQIRFSLTEEGDIFQIFVLPISPFHNVEANNIRKISESNDLTIPINENNQILEFGMIVREFEIPSGTTPLCISATLNLGILNIKVDKNNFVTSKKRPRWGWIDNNTLDSNSVKKNKIK